MMISEAMCVIWEDARERVVLRLARLLRRPQQDGVYQYAVPAAVGVGSDSSVGETADSEFEEIPTLAPDSVPTNRREIDDGRAREIVLTADERRARAIALRGLSQCRGHRFEAARASFVEAAEMDPAIDFAKLPDFWRLPLDAQQAAIEAYEVVGRRRDAAALTAAVRTAFRPKLLRPRPMAQTALPES